MRGLLAAGALFGVLAGLAMKRAWSGGELDARWCAIGSALYVADTVLWVLLLRDEDLGIAGALWGVGSLMLSTMASVLLFGEQLTATRVLGMALAVAALILLSL